MNRHSITALVILFLFTFVFAMTMAAGAANSDPEPRGDCCWFYNECGHMGSGSWDGPVCNCIIPGGGQGWYGKCLYACPANCPPPQ